MVNFLYDNSVIKPRNTCTHRYATLLVEKTLMLHLFFLHWEIRILTTKTATISIFSLLITLPKWGTNIPYLNSNDFFLQL